MWIHGSYQLADKRVPAQVAFPKKTGPPATQIWITRNTRLTVVFGWSMLFPGPLNRPELIGHSSAA
jgi:hypothetical protein